MTIQELRELAAVAWLVFTFVIWTVLIWYVIYRFRTSTWTQFHHDLGNHGAFGLLAYMTGEMLARMWSLVFIETGRPPRDELGWGLLWIGGAFSVWGAICLVRVFAPSWSNVAAGVAVLIIFAALIALRLGMITRYWPGM